MSGHILNEGIHSLNAYMTIADAPAAIEFYKKAFGARELIRMPTPDGKIMHASLVIGDSCLMITEEAPEWGALGPKARGGTSISINLQVPNVDEVFARAIACGATVKMPVADMFWGDRFGMLTDPFGHEWSVATHIKDMTAEEMHEAGRQAMADMAGGPDCTGGPKG